MGVLLTLAYFHLVRTMKCVFYTDGQVSDAAHTGPLYLRISEPTFRQAKSSAERDNDITTVQ